MDDIERELHKRRLLDTLTKRNAGLNLIAPGSNITLDLFWQAIALRSVLPWRVSSRLSFRKTLRRIKASNGD